VVFCECSWCYWAHFFLRAWIHAGCFILTPVRLQEYLCPLPIFRQDSATARTAKSGVCCLQDIFGESVINGDCALLVCQIWTRAINFCLLGMLKDKVYSNNSRTEDNPTESIQHIVLSVSPAELWHGMNSLFVRCDFESQRKTFWELCLNMVNRNLMLPAIDGTKLHRP
jgi:hypothetical protein